MSRRAAATFIVLPARFVTANALSEDAGTLGVVSRISPTKASMIAFASSCTRSQSVMMASSRATGFGDFAGFGMSVSLSSGEGVFGFLKLEQVKPALLRKRVADQRFTAIS